MFYDTQLSFLVSLYTKLIFLNTIQLWAHCKQICTIFSSQCEPTGKNLIIHPVFYERMVYLEHCL